LTGEKFPILEFWVRKLLGVGVIGGITKQVHGFILWFYFIDQFPGDKSYAYIRQTLFYKVLYRFKK